MSAFDTVMSDTIGIAWRAASGTVDPWTAENLTREEAAQLVQASGKSGQFNDITAAVQSGKDVNTVLSQAGAAPSQFWDGVSKSIKQAFTLSGSIGQTMLYIGLAGLAIVIAYEVFVHD